MDDLDRTQIEQVLKLAKDNNRMLHAMRRNAFLGGIFRVILWIVLIVVPLWFYMQYLAPVVSSALNTITQVQELQQGAGANMQAQFTDLNEALQKLKSQFPQYFQQ